MEGGGPTVYEGVMGGPVWLLLVVGEVGVPARVTGQPSPLPPTVIPPSSTDIHSFKRLKAIPQWQAPQISYSLILQVKERQIFFTTMKSIRGL